MTSQEQRAILTLCLMAAFADGGNDATEREQIRRIAEGLSAEVAQELSGLYQDVLLGRASLETAASALADPRTRQLAYEMAVCVCDADGAQSPAEGDFLERLRAALALDAAASREFARAAAEVADAPLEAGPDPTATAAPAVDAQALDKTILNYAILNGALEILPQSLASMAILPLQLKMVYAVGKAYGYELDRGHIKDFAAALGVGLTGQFVEQIRHDYLLNCVITSITAVTTSCRSLSVMAGKRGSDRIRSEA